MAQSVVDPLVQIQIRRSVPLTYGSGSCFFTIGCARCQQNKSFFSVFFLLITFEGKSAFKDKKFLTDEMVIFIIPCGTLKPPCPYAETFFNRAKKYWPENVIGIRDQRQHVVK
jgi:hypothetical protein